MFASTLSVRLQPPFKISISRMPVNYSLFVTYDISRGVHDELNSSVRINDYNFNASSVIFADTIDTMFFSILY